MLLLCFFLYDKGDKANSSREYEENGCFFKGLGGAKVE